MRDDPHAPQRHPPPAPRIALFDARLRRGPKDVTPGKAAYRMGHTAYLYLLDRQGTLRYVFPPDVEDGVLLDGVRRLNREGRASP